MSLWFVPGALTAVGLLPLVVLALRVAGELALLRQEMTRVAALRPAVVELGDDAAAVAAHLQRLRHRR